MLSPLLAPRRAAHAAIEGYLYQTLLGVERWFSLEPNEVLRCEGDEDLDRLLLDGSGGISEQVKALTGGINIRDEVVKGTLRRFTVSHHLLRKAGESRVFVFTTTATLRRQKIGDLGADVLADWNAASDDLAVRQRLVQALRQLLPIPADEEASRDFRRQLVDALTWLNADFERWADLIQSVHWKLGQPDVAGVRRRLLGLLTERGSPPGMLDRLVAEILQVSIEPEPKNRLRTRDDLHRILKSTEEELTRWAASIRATNVHRAIDEVSGLRRWLASRHLDLDRVSPSKLLTANYEVVEFDESARHGDLEALTSFCNSPRLRDLWVVHGDGGLGKTRLLMEGCRRLSAQGWHAGFLVPDVGVQPLAELMEGLAPRLIVVDYAESRLREVQMLVRRMVSAPKPGPKVRAVLLARREGDWIKTLRRSAEEADLLDGRFPSLELQPLPGDGAARWDPFAAAVRTFAGYLGFQMPERLSIPDLGREAFGRPLYLHMAALIAAEGRTAATDEVLLEEVLARERRFWSQEIEGSGTDLERQVQLERAIEPMMATLSLLRGLDDLQCRGLARSLLGQSASDALCQILLNLARRFYAAPTGSAWYLVGLEPDLLGEEIVRQAIRRDESFLVRSFELAQDDQRRIALTVLGRMTQSTHGQDLAARGLALVFDRWLAELAGPAVEVAVALGDPIGQILAPLIDAKASFDLAQRLMVRCDRQDYLQSVPLREVALVSTRRVYRELKLQTGEAGPEVHDQFAKCATQLGIRLSDAGQKDEALEVTEEAVEIYRTLAEQAPETFLPRLAFSLTSLSMRMVSLGRLEGALLAAQEAVKIRRELAKLDTRSSQPDLAQSLNILGVILRDIRHFREALTAFGEAVDILQPLARNEPDAFSFDLARNQSDLALCYQHLDLHQQALRSITDSEILLRRLAEERPDAFRPDLARSLCSTGSVLSDLGQHEMAIAMTAESEEIFRDLAAKRPAAFLSELAGVMETRSSILSRAGLADRALEANREAVESYRSLTSGRPEDDMLRPRLATSLIQRAELLTGANREKEAWGLVREAVQILLPFYAAYPAVYRGALHRSKVASERLTLLAGSEVDHRLSALLDRLLEELES